MATNAYLIIPIKATKTWLATSRPKPRLHPINMDQVNQTKAHFKSLIQHDSHFIPKLFHFVFYLQR